MLVATLFDERGRVVLSSCHAVPRGRSVDLERMRKLEIQDVGRIRKEINYLNLPFGQLDCSNNYSEYGIKEIVCRILK